MLFVNVQPLLCVDLVFGRKYVQLPIICSLQYSLIINTFGVDPHSDSLHNDVVKPKNVIGNNILHIGCQSQRM